MMETKDTSEEMAVGMGGWMGWGEDMIVLS